VRNTRATTIPLVAPVADLPISEEDFDIEDDEESLYERLEGDDLSSVAADVNVPLTIPSAVPGLSSSLSSLALASAPCSSVLYLDTFVLFIACLYCTFYYRLYRTYFPSLVCTVRSTIDRTVRTSLLVFVS
jgi:hypothetical protein